eukprot:c39023_g1_i1.p1 GENE.c39023_g1_i1~~c39023_g1_i1.p1  ORF type:complete len:544 (+),score=127.16 c39023_g1_i1:150-1634(+)
MAERMWHLRQKHIANVHRTFEDLTSKTPKDHITEMIRSGHPDHVRQMRRNLHNMYRPSPAISLLEKTSYSKAIPPQEEMDTMKAMFGFDDAKLRAELEKLRESEPDVIQADADALSEHDADGFSEEAIKAELAKQDKSKVIQQESTTDLLQVEEGVQLKTETKKVLDWSKWQKFMLSEFEAARMTGELDATAQRMRAAAPPALSPLLSNNMELSEGLGATSGAEASAADFTDKLCGCSVALDPVCGSDGQTYPSNCFAKCAGLQVSHQGPCLSKADLEQVGSYKVLTNRPERFKREGKLEAQQLIAIDDESVDSPLFDDVPTTAPEAGVDFPSMTPSDARSEARQARTDGLVAKEVTLPYKHVITHQQFNADLKQLVKVAEEFEPALSNEKMAQCQCRGGYAPVCGKDRKTYPSPCYASCMGVSLSHVGACLDDPKLDQDVPTTLDDIRDPLCFCSLKQKPVCGVNGQTFINRCFAQCENITVQAEGPCYTVKA